jgi:hypothetical protein
MTLKELTTTLESMVRELEALEKARDPSYGWPEAGLLLTLRKAWANYDYEKHGPRASP